jgi:hypothetical protein
MASAAVPFAPPGMAIRYITMPPSEAAEVLANAQAFAEGMDRLKQRGLYVDVDGSGRIRQPSEITVPEVREQLDRARRAVSATEALLKPGAPLWPADSQAAEVEFSRALVSAFSQTGLARSPEAAADVLRNTAAKLRG